MRGPLFEVMQCGSARAIRARGASHASARRAQKMNKKMTVFFVFKRLL
jgi:hypothetical protein